MVQTEQATRKTLIINLTGFVHKLRNNPENKQILIIILGSVIFMGAGFLNFSDEYFKGWSQQNPVIGYLLFGFTVLALVPIAIGTRKLANSSFRNQIRKTGRLTGFWLLLYTGAVLLDLLVAGWPMVAVLSMALLIGSRIIGFYFLSKMFSRIRVNFDIRVSSFIFLFYGIFYILTSIIGGIAGIAQDDLMTNLIFVFNGILESILIILVGGFLIINFYKIWLLLNRDVDSSQSLNPSTNSNYKISNA